MSTDKKVLLFLDHSNCCDIIRNAIHERGMDDEFKYYDVTDRAVVSRLPPHFKVVPLLIGKDMNTHLEGKEVLTWILSRKFLNITTTNYLKQVNPTFHVDPTIGKQHDGQFAALIERDGQIHNASDRAIDVRSTYVDTWESNHLTEYINKRLKDEKITDREIKCRLETLEKQRNNELEELIMKNKKF